MQLVGWARSMAAVAAACAIGGALAQDMFRPAGQWPDDQGQAYRLEALYGAPTVITMAYGACRRVCSTSLRMMKQVQQLADVRHLNLNFVVVGLLHDLRIVLLSAQAHPLRRIDAFDQSVGTPLP